MATAAKKLHEHAKPGSVQSVSIADAKANLSSLVARVEKKRTPITIMRRGVPVARLVSLSEEKPPSLYGSMRGTVQELGDIVGPTGVEWTLSESDD
jgi:prevent-host-death family protein